MTKVRTTSRLGKAIEMRKKEMLPEAKRLKEFKKILKDGILKKIPDTHLNGHPEDCLPGTFNASFKGAEGEAILLYLDMEGIAVSTGSACTSGTLEPSHVLTRMGVDAADAQGSLRFSLGRDNTKEDIDYVLTVLPPIIQRLRDMSPLYEKKRE